MTSALEAFSIIPSAPQATSLNSLPSTNGRGNGPSFASMLSSLQSQGKPELPVPSSSNTELGNANQKTVSSFPGGLPVKAKPAAGTTLTPNANSFASLSVALPLVPPLIPLPLPPLPEPATSNSAAPLPQVQAQPVVSTQGPAQIQVQSQLRTSAPSPNQSQDLTSSQSQIPVFVTAPESLNATQNVQTETQPASTPVPALVPDSTPLTKSAQLGSATPVDIPLPLTGSYLASNSSTESNSTIATNATNLIADTDATTATNSTIATHSIKTINSTTVTNSTTAASPATVTGPSTITAPTKIAAPTGIATPTALADPVPVAASSQVSDIAASAGPTSAGPTPTTPPVSAASATASPIPVSAPAYVPVTPAIVATLEVLSPSQVSYAPPSSLQAPGASKASAQPIPIPPPTQVTLGGPSPLDSPSASVPQLLAPLPHPSLEADSDADAQQVPQNLQEPRTVPVPAADLTPAYTLPAVPDSTLLAANSPLPNLQPPPEPQPAPPDPVSNAAPTNAAPTSQPPTPTAATAQPTSAPAVTSASLASASASPIVAAAPASSNRTSNPSKNAPTVITAASPTSQPPRPSPSQTNDSAALQNEFSLASALVYPAATSNLPNVHTLVNSAALPVTTTPVHPGVAKSSTADNPANTTNTSAPSAPAASTPPPSPTPAKAVPGTATPNDPSLEHALPATGAIPIANTQPAPAPVAPPATNVSSTTATLPTPVSANSNPPQLPPTQPSAPTTPNATPELPPATPPATTPVQMAQMVTNASQSEMRIGMSTPAFGSVEVRTVVHAADVNLSVGSEKGDLHSFLSNELPTIANSLQQQSLRLAQVSFHQGSGLSGNSYSGGGSQYQRPNSPAYSSGSINNEQTIEASSDPESYSLGSGSSLSILA